MEFNFSVNALFREKLSKVKNNLLPDNYSPDRRGDGDVIGKVSAIVDKMGVVSAKAQKLPHVITSAAKLNHSEHILYILTDPEGNRGHGTVVGILKVGCKKLFVYDVNGIQWEMEPLCVLDFYIHEPNQRMGCGKVLFEYMLKDQQVQPQHLALDQPSESFLGFMCKHYGLDSIIPQNNSFVVYDGFFSGRSDKCRGSDLGSSQSAKKANKNQCVKATSRPGDTPLSAFGRHSARKAETTMAQYMQDTPTRAHNGGRQCTHPTNNNTAVTKTNNTATQLQKPMESNGVDNHSRPTSFPSKLNGPSPPPAPFQRSDEDTTDGYAETKHTSQRNGSEGSPEEEVHGHLDLKFHHTHLCKASSHLWALNQHSVPLAQYGHYWSSVGELLSEEQIDESDYVSFPNGNGNTPKERKVSNIPIGKDSEGDSEDVSNMTQSTAEQNGHTKCHGNDTESGVPGVRDVRIKKTMFQNLSPYRN